MSSLTSSMPDRLRRQLAIEYAPVRRLPSPAVRALWTLPFVALALLAAPVWFRVRADAVALGPWGSWGLSLLQAGLGVAVVMAALREAVPGRALSGRALALWFVLPIACVTAVTWSTWWWSRQATDDPWLLIAGMCVAGSLASALPIVAVTVALAARAFPTRPMLTGFLAGLGAGTVADAGWRIFCHYSEPAHVLSAHLGAVLAAGVCGAFLARALIRPRRRYFPTSL